MIQSGWRILYHINDTDPFLRSANETSRWPHRRAFQATCNYLDHETRGDGTPPIADCSCGIYALKQVGNEMYGYFRQGHRAIRSIVEIAQWGRILEGPQGVRSEFACIKTIYNESEAHCKILSEAYAVPAFSGDLYTELSQRIENGMRDANSLPAPREARHVTRQDLERLGNDLSEEERRALEQIVYQREYRTWYNKVKACRIQIPVSQRRLKYYEDRLATLLANKPTRQSLKGGA